MQLILVIANSPFGADTKISLRPMVRKDQNGTDADDQLPFSLRLASGLDLREAMEASLDDLDGSFSYLAATPEAMGYARDPWALKPLLWAENDAFVAVATEEIAMRSALHGDYEVRETPAKEVQVWQR